MYRIGGDEFAVVLQGDEFDDREELFALLKKRCVQTCEEYTEWWDQVRVSFGAAVYDPAEDPSVDDVVRRADKNMYEDKRLRKTGRIE